MTDESMRSPPRILEDRCLRKGAKFDFHVLSVRYGSGVTVEREAIRHPGAVTIVPLLTSPDGDRIVMIRNHRIAPDRLLLELPAGTLGDGEDPAEAAARETAEETGYQPATVEAIGRFYTSPGMSDELMHVYVARGLESDEQRLEADEHITVEPMSVDEVWRAANDGELMDGKTLAALVLAATSGCISARSISRTDDHR